MRRRQHHEIADQLTPFGAEVLAAIDRKGLYLQNFCQQVGIAQRMRIDYLFYSPNGHVPIALVFAIASTLELSPITLISRLYEAQESTKDLPEHEKQRQIMFIAMFDRFFRLRDVEQKTMFFLHSSLLGRELYSISESTIDAHFPHPVSFSLGEVVQEKMKELEFSIGQMSRQLGISSEAFRNLLHKDSYGIFLPLLYKIAEILDIYPMMLFLLAYLKYDPASRLAEKFVPMQTYYDQFLSTFFALSLEQQESQIIMANLLLKQHGAREFPEDEQYFLNKSLRMQPLKARMLNPVYVPKYREAKASTS